MIRTEFPRRVREIEHTWIPLADGTRLAARIWLPEDAEDDPVPAILEFLPYRKVDGMAIRDAARQPYLAGFGYAAVRVDMRGTGESDGIITDEYTEQCSTGISEAPSDSSTSTWRPRTRATRSTRSRSATRSRPRCASTRHRG